MPDQSHRSLWERVLAEQSPQAGPGILDIVQRTRARLSAQSALDRGRSFAATGDHIRAIASFDEAIGLDPNLASAYSGRGASFAWRGDHVRAIASYDEAIGLDPKQALVHSWRGSSVALSGDDIRAIASFDEAIRLDPNLVEAYLERGRTFSRLEDFVRSIADLQRAAALAPNNRLIIEALDAVTRSQNNFRAMPTQFSNNADAMQRQLNVDWRRTRGEVYAERRAVTQQLSDIQGMVNSGAPFWAAKLISKISR
jgi:tetratricopeptide (TPR) repeat protein